MSRITIQEYRASIQGYTDLGFQNVWSTFPEQWQKCRELGHKNLRHYDNSLYPNRGTDNIDICDQCKILWHYDSSD